MRKIALTHAIMVIALLAGGCVGRDRVGAFTTDNLGIIVQSTPTPQVAVNFARQEGVLEPVFENGSTPSIAASVQHADTGGVTKLGADIKSIFAGGNAAVLVAGQDPGSTGIDAVACIDTPLTNGDGWIINAPGSSSPLLFGTDTVIGLKVSFAVGATAGMVSGNLGYKRDELAITPVFGKPGGCTHEQLVAQAQANLDAAKDKLKHDQDQKSDTAKLAEDNIAVQVADASYRSISSDANKAKYAIYVPSTIAIASDSVGATPATTGGGSVGFNVAQVFATGKAAEVIGKEYSFGAIGRVAGSITNPAAIKSSQNTQTFTVALAKGATLAAGTAVSIKPSLPSASINLPSDAFSYSTTKNDKDAADVAAGLAKQINSSSSDKTLGVTAEAKSDQISLAIPSNLGAIGSSIKWTCSSNPATVTIAPASGGSCTASN